MGFNYTHKIHIIGIFVYFLCSFSDFLTIFPPDSRRTSAAGRFSALAVFLFEVSMFGLLNSLVDLATSVATVVAAPVKIVVDVAGAAVKPVADVAKTLVDDVKSLKD